MLVTQTSSMCGLCGYKENQKTVADGLISQQAKYSY